VWKLKMDFIWTAFISILDGLLGSDEKKKKEENSKIALYSAMLHNKKKKG